MYWKIVAASILSFYHTSLTSLFAKGHFTPFLILYQTEKIWPFPNTKRSADIGWDVTKDSCLL